MALSQLLVKRKVNEFVDIVAASAVNAFYPTAVAKYAKTSVENVFKYLLSFTQSGELELKWELRCPDFLCGNTLDVTNKQVNNEDIVSCPKCGIEFEVSAHDFFPVFVITEEMKRIVREEKLKKNRITTLKLI
jgi:hypothetical protein